MAPTVGSVPHLLALPRRHGYLPLMFSLPSSVGLILTFLLHTGELALPPWSLQPCPGPDPANRGL